MKWFKSVLTENYANFDGRARREEFWMFTLFYMIIVMVLSVIAGIGLIITEETGNIVPLVIAAAPVTIFYLYSLIPALAVSVRRLHDVGKSGWWLATTAIPYVGSIFSIYLMVLYCTEGHGVDNEFGPDPKELSAAVVM